MGEHEGHRERLRDRAAKTGLKGFEPHEVLELLLCETIPRKNVNPLAHDLIEHFGSLSGVLDASREELMKVKGVGELTASHLSMQSDFYAYYMHDRWGKRPRLLNRRDVGEYCTTMFGRQQVETMALVCLDTQNGVIASETLSTGTVGEVVLYTRTVAQCALRHNAQKVILVHNHPSGELTPSAGDVEVSLRLIEVLDNLDIQMLDHIIVAGDRYASLVDLNLIEHPGRRGPASRPGSEAARLQSVPFLEEEESEETPY